MSLIFNRKRKIFVGFLLGFSVMSVSDGVDISGADPIDTATDFCTIDTLGISDGTAALEAIWTRVSITCSAGTYLRAGDTECSPCLADNYCEETTCIFSENSDCGIATCNPTTETAWVSPVGAKTEFECGRRLHVGNDVIYLRRNKITTPSLNVMYRGVQLYANLTETSTQMNINTSQKLVLQYDNKTYYAYDGTVDVAE